MSIESNLQSTVRKDGFGAKFKKYLLSKADAYQITGIPQKNYIEHFYPAARHKPFIKLPNLIDEEVFKIQIGKLRQNNDALRAEFGVDKKTQFWVLPAQLIPIKGILPFLELLKNCRGFKLFILGDGELFEEAKALIDREKLPVTLVGFVQQETVINYYAAADLFVLPSFKDASPLTPIEASAAGLPLLVSSRIGNLEDVLEENENGWCYDPKGDTEIAKQILEKIVQLPREELKKMGAKSLLRYDTIFNTEKCLINYAESLQDL